MDKLFLESLALEAKNLDIKLFDSPEAKESVCEITEAFVNEVRERGIRNIILPDSSARPLWVGFAELWHIKFPGEKMPGIFFVNPEGLHLSTEEIDELFWTLGIVNIVDDLEKLASQVNSQKREEFENRFSGLIKMKDEPLLILDTCVHTGRTMELILKFLEPYGFSNILTAAVSQDYNSNFKTDFYLTEKRPEFPCYPAGPEGLVDKMNNGVVSDPNNDTLIRELSLKTRDEIKEIIKERFKKEEE